jgi:holo-[acyl-carrier protein] synthase
MIVGIGNDVIDIRRIEKAIERYGERFLNRIFTDVERARSDGKAGRTASYAKRFAAKEACAKALGTGIARGVHWRDMGVVNLDSGRPTMRLTGGAARQLARLMPSGYEPQVHLTLTDDFPMAHAVVVISGVATGSAGGYGNSA